MKAPLPIVGGCACGAVRYEATVQPLMVTVCHCTTCQRRTGSAFAMTMPIARASFRLTSGQTISRTLPTASGSTNTHYFCEACLVRTHTEPASNDSLIFIRPGTLDDPSWITPIAQIWTRSAHRWALADGVDCIEQNPPDPAALVRAWREG